MKVEGSNPSRSAKMIHTIMKYFLTLLIVFLMGYTLPAIAGDMTEDEFLTGLESRYRESTLLILQECADDAEWVRKAAIMRDTGLTMRAMHYQIIDDADEQNKTRKIPYKTEDVLYRLSLVIWVFSNDNLTPEEIYNTNNSYCYTESMAYLNLLYNRAKTYYLYQKGLMDVLPEE